MNFKKLSGFIAVAVVAFSTLAAASTTTPLVNREEFTVGKGDLQTQFSMVPNLFRGDVDQTTFNLGMGANYFWDNMFAPGVEFDWAHVSGTDNVLFLPNLKVYWPLHKRILPYFQLGMGYGHSFTHDLFDIRFSPGVDFMLANNVAIGFALKYDLGVGDATIHQIQFPIQFAIYFKL